MADVKDYALRGKAKIPVIPAPKLKYLPRKPKAYSPKIGLIGAGGITEFHLKAYRKAGLEVVAICDIDPKRARARKKEFYPKAKVCQTHHEVLATKGVEVVDIATHPAERVALIEDAIAAGKHVFSQKPFVLDLDVGERLCDLADAAGVKLAVNQNGRWAPHFSYIHQAILSGVLGQVSSLDFVMQWDHTWTKGTPFEKIYHLILYDFAIHWFDIATQFMGGESPEKVYASVQRTRTQDVAPPMLAQVVADYKGAQARLLFSADCAYGPEDRTVVCGSQGTIRSSGPNVDKQQVELWTEDGVAYPKLSGMWFDNGFRGTMLELLCAIEEDREPTNSGRNNLKSLEFCFAAVKSADTGRPQKPGKVRTLGSKTL